MAVNQWQLAEVKQQPSPDIPRSGQKRSMQACDYCRTKKVKCNGGSPCTQCLDRGKRCVRNLKNRKQSARGKDKSRPATKQLNPTSTHDNYLETNFALANGTEINTSARHQESPNYVRYPCQMVPLSDEQKKAKNDRILSTQQTPALSIPNQYDERTAYQYTSHAAELSRSTLPASRSFDSPEDETVCPAEMSHSEYHGPRSFFSIFSKPGIAWVTEKTKTAGFQEVAHNFMRDVTAKLKLEGKISHIRASEPEPELAWKYVEAYFEEAQEAAFGVIHRSWFEARLRAHFSRVETKEDAAWYALRNVVYAYGHRFVFPDQSKFGTTQGSSWSWFENALSVHSELIFARTSLVGVQALTVMAYYTESLTGIHIQYMLATTAIHLACSKGLHRQPAPSWGMNPEMIRQRSRIFWAIYCLEKAIVGRTGRPSALDDNEITLNPPSASQVSNYPNSTYCALLVQISQMTSVIVKRLNSAQVLRDSPEETLQTIIKLDSQLRYLKKSIELVLDIDSLIDPSKLSPLLTLRQALDLQFAYFSAVFNLHSSLANPWSISSLRSKADPKLQDELRRCSWTAAAAAKTAIMSTNLVRVDATSHIAHAYFIPVFAMITLFVHTIQNLTDAKMKSELILLDLAVGHFARLQITAGFEVRFARELTQFANRVGESQNMLSNWAKGDHLWSDTTQVAPTNLPSSHNDTNTNVLGNGNVAGHSQDFEDLFGTDGNVGVMWDMDMWSMLLEDFADVQ